MSKDPDLDYAVRATKAKKWAIELLNHLNDSNNKDSDDKPLLPNQYNSGT
jgi:hypothetical protein